MVNCTEAYLKTIRFIDNYWNVELKTLGEIINKYEYSINFVI